MDDEVILRRAAGFDLPADDLWSLVADGATWSGWLGDRAEVDVAAGGEGTVVDDDGTERSVRVEHVDRGEGIRFTWWPAADPARASRVELLVVEGPRGTSTLRITEALPGVSARASARASAGTWDVRLLALWLLVGRLVKA